eukprot:1691594-Karenia_brevis.AAC.1
MSSNQSAPRGNDRRRRTRERSKRSKLLRSRENVEAAKRLSREDVEVRAPAEDEEMVRRRRRGRDDDSSSES